MMQGVDKKTGGFGRSSLHPPVPFLSPFLFFRRSLHRRHEQHNRGNIKKCGGAERDGDDSGCEEFFSSGPEILSERQYGSDDAEQ